MDRKVDSALKAWQAAKDAWGTTPSRPEFCRPWSEEDYRQRLATFGMAPNKDVAQRLAAEGFQQGPDGTISCLICKTTADPEERNEHRIHCPWRGRPFALLRTSWRFDHKPTDTRFDHCRHALGAMEDVQVVMKTISRGLHS